MKHPDSDFYRPDPMPFWLAALILFVVTVGVYGLYTLAVIGVDALGWL